jgi:5-methylcytosine-specific restriction enzyme A
MESPFQINQVIKRSDIHDIYGGNRQSGISVPANFPFIFIFSSNTGHQHGYKDQWENDDVFSYTGEGQEGNMKFEKGNLTLLNHVESNKRIFLFIYLRKGVVSYDGELELIDFDYFRTKDRNGDEREAIKFFFKRAGKSLGYQVNTNIPSINEAPISFTKDKNVPSETERKGLITSRVGQGAYRKSILYRWGFECAVTGYSKHEILIASHIVPWKDSTNEERLDVHNGVLLSPTYDALFDQHLISFENNGKIILSNILADTHYSKIGVTGTERIKNLSFENYQYLDRHRSVLL